MELTDLSLLAASVQKRYQECFIPKDCHLPENFKEHFKKFNYNDLNILSILWLSMLHLL